MDCTYCDREDLSTYYIIDLDSCQEIACEGCNDYLYKQVNIEQIDHCNCGKCPIIEEDK